jgi:hypothetical protein
MGNRITGRQIMGEQMKPKSRFVLIAMTFVLLVTLSTCGFLYYYSASFGDVWLKALALAKDPDTKEPIIRALATNSIAMTQIQIKMVEAALELAIGIGIFCCFAFLGVYLHLRKLEQSRSGPQ